MLLGNTDSIQVTNTKFRIVAMFVTADLRTAALGYVYDLSHIPSELWGTASSFALQ